MSYAVLADVEGKVHQAELEQLCFNGNPDDYVDESGEPDPDALATAKTEAVETRVALAITDAEGFVDGYLARRYTVPVSPVDNLVRTLTADIAIYYLFDGRQDSEQWKFRFDHAVKTLRMIADGSIALSADVSASPGSGNEPEIESATRVFNREKLRGW